MPFVQRKFKNMDYDPVAFLGFLVQCAFKFVCKVSSRAHSRRALDDNVAIFMNDFPLRVLVSDAVSSSLK